MALPRPRASISGLSAARGSTAVHLDAEDLWESSMGISTIDDDDDGLSMVYQWFINGLSMVYQWFINGLSMVYQWFINGLSMAYQWFINGYYWILLDINGY